MWGGECRSSKKFGTALVGDYSVVEEHYSGINALKAIKLRKTSMQIHMLLQSYLVNRETKVPDALIGHILDEGLALARSTDMDVDGMERHLARHREGRFTKVVVCHN